MKGRLKQPERNFRGYERIIKKNKTALIFKNRVVAVVVAAAGVVVVVVVVVVVQLDLVPIMVVVLGKIRFGRT